MPTYITALHKFFRSRQLIASIGFQFQQWYLEIKQNDHGVAVGACTYILLPILILIHQLPRGSDNETGVGGSLVNICDLQTQTPAFVKHSFPKRSGRYGCLIIYDTNIYLFEKKVDQRHIPAVTGDCQQSRLNAC